MSAPKPCPRGCHRFPAGDPGICPGCRTRAEPDGWEYHETEQGQFFINEGLKRVLSMSRIRSLLSRAGLAIVPASDVPSPISDETLRHLTECAHAWEDKACLIGNVTARQLQAFCAELADLRADAPSVEERVMVEAAGDINARTLEYWRDYVGEDFGDSDGLAFFAVSELARRAAKEKS